MKIGNVNINYTLYGNKDNATIVLLHGWGQNIEMMQPIGDKLSDQYQILILDLPGFGKSDHLDTPWTLKDYVDAIHKIIDNLKLDKIIMVGHSFGGKLALLYSSIYKVDKLVVFASPINHHNKVSTKTKILKTIKKIPGTNKISELAKKYIGSKDYRDADPIMRSVLVNHIQTDIYDDLAKIKAPTLIVWGTNDEAVDVSVAYEIEKAIKDSGVVIYEGCTHYAYLERLGQTINVLKSFLGGK